MSIFVKAIGFKEPITHLTNTNQIDYYLLMGGGSHVNVVLESDTLNGKPLPLDFINSLRAENKKKPLVSNPHINELGMEEAYAVVEAAAFRNLVGYLSNVPIYVGNISNASVGFLPEDKFYNNDIGTFLNDGEQGMFKNRDLLLTLPKFVLND